jgi:hypothetical protein
VRVVVADADGEPVRFAVVQRAGSVVRTVTDSSGVAVLFSVASDSLRLLVRRVGFVPFHEWVRRSAAGPDYAVTIALRPDVPIPLGGSRSAGDRLARTGFYERIARARSAGARMRFFAPEDLALRDAFRLTELLREVAFLQVDRGYPGAFRHHAIMGIDRCAANVLVDGFAPPWTLEDALFDSDFRSSPFGLAIGSDSAFSRGDAIPLDRLTSPGSIAGLEVYASAHGAPVELRLRASRHGCPLIAIWTGPRQ